MTIGACRKCGTNYVELATADFCSACIITSLKGRVAELEAKLAVPKPTEMSTQEMMLVEMRAQTRFLETIARAASSMRSSR